MSENVIPAPPQSRTEYVAARIKADVANGMFAPGKLIKQTVLAERYGVSPTPVREALRILEADGVITYAPHKGATIREMSPGSAHDLYRLRAAVEKTATEMATERSTPESLAAMHSSFDALSKALADDSTSPASLSVLNKEFHFAIYNATSPVVVQYLELLWSRFTPPATVFIDRRSSVRLHKEHKKILNAITSGDGQLASELMAEHILGAGKLRDRLPEVRASGHSE